jgi:hypothetical protein
LRDVGTAVAVGLDEIPNFPFSCAVKEESSISVIFTAIKLRSAFNDLLTTS